MRRKKTIEVRFPTQEGHAILTELAKPPVHGCERVVFALAGVSSTPMTDAILVSSPKPVPEDAYLLTEGGTSWDPRFTAKVGEEAMRRRLGVMMIHAHQFSELPRLSISDRTSFERVLPALRVTSPASPHGSVVIGVDLNVGGIVWLPGRGIMSVSQAKWLGSPIVVQPPVLVAEAAADTYKSQIDLIGVDGQRKLGRATIGVIGLGGGGSMVVQQAARAGFGKLVLVDHDLVEEKNRSRTVGTRSIDVGKPKAMAMKRLASEASKAVRVETCTDRFPSQASIELLKTCDLIVSCVDTFSARSEVAKFSLRHLIPVIDVGIGTHTNDSKAGRRIDALAGHMHVYLPGDPCMWCTGLLTAEKIKEESGGHPEYLEGQGGPGQVISFNGVVSSLAVTESIQLVTGMLQGGSGKRYLQYDGIERRLLYESPARRPDCFACQTELGAGDSTWDERV